MSTDRFSAEHRRAVEPASYWCRLPRGCHRRSSHRPGAGCAIFAGDRFDQPMMVGPEHAAGGRVVEFDNAVMQRLDGAAIDGRIDELDGRAAAERAAMTPPTLLTFKWSWWRALEQDRAVIPGFDLAAMLVRNSRDGVEYDFAVIMATNVPPSLVTLTSLPSSLMTLSQPVASNLPWFVTPSSSRRSAERCRGRRPLPARPARL